MNWKTAVAMAAGFAILLAFMGWAFWTTGSMRLAGASSTTSLVMILAGVLGTGALAGGLMWLAFYSSRKGYDESPRFDVADVGGEPPPPLWGPPPPMGEEKGVALSSPSGGSPGEAGEGGPAAEPPE
jgi:hypothetical protein